MIPCRTGLGVRRVGQVPRLLPLDHVHVGRGVEIPAVGAVGSIAPLAVLAPNVRVADVVVVRDRDRGAVPDQVAELQAELDPASGVFSVPIGLVTGEEQQVRVLGEQVLDDLRPTARGAAGVARHVRHHNRVLLGRVTADRTLERGRLAVPHAVLDALRGVPLPDAKVGAPAGVLDRRLPQLDPPPVAFHFQPGLARFVRPERVELGGQLEHAAIDGVEGERDNLIAGHVERWRGIGPFRLRLLPPLADGQGIEVRELVAERMGSGDLRPGRRAERGGGKDAQTEVATVRPKRVTGLGSGRFGREVELRSAFFQSTAGFG